jgi:hypothetical protein
MATSSQIATFLTLGELEALEQPPSIIDKTVYYALETLRRECVI